MEQLKVGDKVCLVKIQRIGVGTSYSFSEVERLTKKMAVLKNGTKLINEPKTKYSNNNIPKFSEYGDSWTFWQRTTPEILEACKKEQQRNKISNWFNNRKFTDEEKAIIYNTFKEPNILDGMLSKTNL
jgi:hypothetical protein